MSSDVDTRVLSLARRILVRHKVSLHPLTLMEYLATLRPLFCLSKETIMQHENYIYQLESAKTVMASTFKRVKVPEAEKLALRITFELLEEIEEKLCGKSSY